MLEMIYSRTENDISLSRSIILRKVQNGEDLTDSELLTLERGTLTVKTLNRIENKQSELNTIFEQYFYFFGVVETKSWKDGDIFKQSDFERILKNNTILRTAFYVMTDTPENPLPKYHFQNINDLEKILADLEENLNYMISHFRQCGATQCGG